MSREGVCFSQATLKISAGFPSQFPRDPRPQIAFSGRSNVGKSSLINTLLDRKSLARVSGQPGKTITVNFYDIDKKLYFVDLPGYGFAKRPAEDKRRWSALTDGYFVKNPDIDRLCLVVQLVDIRIGPTEDDRMMLNYLREAGLPHLIAASKADKLSKTAVGVAVEALARDYPDTPILPFSSLNGFGKEQLRAQILHYAALK